MSEPARRERIEALALAEGLEIDKRGVLDVLLSNGSFDVQACPGSGKTTTVAAKIVVLLTERRKNAGLCVLTHTNVAREEIQAKLRRSPVGLAALASPHFIGTIQSFTDTFLALPYLRSRGVSVDQIDNEAFEVAALAEFRRGYPNLRSWLKRNPGAGEDRYKAVEYHAVTGDVTFNGIPTGLVDKTRPTYQELLRLKQVLSGRGMFRHGDMYFYANKYLDEYKWAVEALRSRFTTLIVDEMQDTSARQEQLLNRIFPPDKVEVQRFGDVNQAIYDMDSQEDYHTTFPREPVLYLGDSRRFGKFIADNIAIIAPHRQTILGEKNAPVAEHTVFLFDERTVLGVIPAFAELAARHVHGIDRPVVRVIGNRKRPSQKGEFPHSLNDYVSEPLPDSLPAANATDSMRLQIERARLARRRDPHSGPSEILIAIRRLIRLWKSSKKVSDVMRDLMTTPKHRQVVGHTVLTLLQKPNFDAAGWSEALDPLMKVLAQNLGCEAPLAANTYVEWCDVPNMAIDAEHIATPKDLPVAVNIETIHAVKGQNHDATLVLETQFHEHDVSFVLPYLADPSKKPRQGTRLTMHRRRMFVAMSRPRKLLCLAAASANVSEGIRAALRGQGWCVVDLTKSVDPETAVFGSEG